jgi:hypothetical protein
MAFWDFLTGTPSKIKEVSTLNKQQRPLHEQLVNAGLGEGAGGAFGTTADYYRNLLSDNPADLQAFSAPEFRNFRENIFPGIQEQFAGMGAGGLSSSGFQNAAIGAGTDLAERIAAIRAGLRQQGAQGLQNIGSLGLNPVKENLYMQGNEGLVPAIGSFASSALSPVAGTIGGLFSDKLKNSFGVPKIGRNTSPYGNMGTNAAQQGSGFIGR